mgnify:FL=1
MRILRGPRPPKELFYKMLIDAAASQSTCARRAVGGVAFDKEGRIVSIGFNGVPKGWPHCNEGNPCSGAQDESGNTTRCDAVHVEKNLLLNCSNPDKIYLVVLPIYPCKDCAILLANLRYLNEVLYFDIYPDTRGLEILDKSGIKHRKISVT